MRGGRANVDTQDEKRVTGNRRRMMFWFLADLQGERAKLSNSENKRVRGD